MARKTGNWAWPLAIVVATLILATAAYLIFAAIARVPVQTVRSGVEGLAEIASAFHQGTVETSFRSYTSQIGEASRLQFSELETVEQFERKESATVLWGALALPDVVVKATVPVTYTYYFDLQDRWRLDLDGHRLTVEIPAIRFNPPAPDVSELDLEAVEASVLRDEDAVVEALRARLTPLLEERARQHIELVREVGGRRAELFVREWILNDFPHAEDLRVDVVFADEEPSVGVELSGD